MGSISTLSRPRCVVSNIFPCEIKLYQQSHCHSPRSICLLLNGIWSLKFSGSNLNVEFNGTINISRESNPLYPQIQTTTTWGCMLEASPLMRRENQRSTYSNIIRHLTEHFTTVSFSSHSTRVFYISLKKKGRGEERKLHSQST